MGIGVSTSVNTTVQQTLNTIMQKSTAACATTCSQIQSGNTVFLDGSTTGDISFVQQCTSDANCQITNSVEAAATALQQSIQNAAASPSWFIGIQVSTDVNTTVQQVEQNINQTLESTCGTSANQTQSGNLVFARNSQTGNISFVQSTQQRLQCVLSNLAKGTVATNQQADQTANSGGAVALGIAGIVLLVVIIIAIVAALNAGSKKRQQASQPQPTYQQPAVSSRAVGSNLPRGAYPTGKSLPPVPR